MKRFTKLMSLLLFMATMQYSCINDADVDSSSIHSDSNGNVALFIEIPNNSSSRSVESSGETSNGLKEEYAVKSLALYFFDSATKTFVGSYDLKNISLASISNNQRIQYTADKIEVEPGTYNIFAVANGKATATAATTQDQFLNTIDKNTYKVGKIPSAPESGFMMTNRGAANLNVKINKPTDSDKVTSVSISLERTVAKIELTQKENEFNLEEKGNVYATIKLTNFRMLNLPTQFYMFRHTAILTTPQEPEAYTNENFGDINDNNGYIIDPYFFKKTAEGAKNFTNEDGFFAQALVDMDPNTNDGYWAGLGPKDTWSSIYCLENGLFRTAQYNAYSTGIMFKANINIANGHAFDEKGSVITDSHERPAMFYYDYNFYTSVDAVRKLVKNDLPSDIDDNSSTEKLAEHHIKKFTKKENYSCYYNYWIKHQNDLIDDETGVMEFCIVRNNIYRISVTKIAGLGSGDPFIDPGQPDEFKAELKANIDVFPWAIRNQDAELD